MYIIIFIIIKILYQKDHSVFLTFKGKHYVCLYENVKLYYIKTSNSHSIELYLNIGITLYYINS